MDKARDNKSQQVKELENEVKLEIAKKKAAKKAAEAKLWIT